MKGSTVARAAAAATVSLALSGCFGPGGRWQIPSFMQPPPAAPAIHRYQPTPAETPPRAGEQWNNSSPVYENETPAENGGAPHSASHVAPAAAPAPPAAPSPKATVTLADGPSKDRALRMLDDAGEKLAKINRNALGSDGATTYDQASAFLRAGRKAATDDDYVAASGFAEKAVILAGKLAPTSP